MTTPIADALIAFAQNVSLDAMSAPARARARLVLLDSIGAALAARPHRIGEIVCAHARAMGGPPEASLIGGGRASALAAAYANGALANAADFDEGSHVATFALASALAMAQRERASGADFLAAFVTGFEAGARLKDSIDARGGAQSLAARGFWSIGIIGPVASALACARLLRLDEDRTRAALSLAACAGGGLRLQLGAFAKALHSGQAARAGLEAALLAQAGASGDPRALDHAQGLLTAFAGPNAPDLAPFDAMRAGALVLDAPTKIKAMPVCTPIAPALDAAIALAQAHDLRAPDIAGVTVDFQTHSLFRDLPPDEDSAPFCAPYLVAAALARRRVTLAETSGKSLRDKEILTLAARMRHEPGASLVVTTADGRRLEQTLGAVRRLVAQEEIVAKFDACAAEALEPSAAQDLRTRLLDVDNLADVSDL